MPEKITLKPKGFRAFGQPMGKPAEGQEVRMPYEGELRTFIYRDGKLWLVKDESSK